MEFIYAAQIIAGLLCKWRHGKEWRPLESRIFPVQGYFASAYYCPRCKSEVTVWRRMAREERRQFYTLFFGR